MTDGDVLMFAGFAFFGLLHPRLGWAIMLAASLVALFYEPSATTTLTP